MTIRTDYIAGEKRYADQINEENAYLLAQGKAVGNGKAQSLYGDYSKNWYTDDGNILFDESTSQIIVTNLNDGGGRYNRSVSLDLTGANNVLGVAKIGSYIYALLYDNSPLNQAVVRYNLDLTSPTTMTAPFIGTTVATSMASDGTDLYFTNRAGRGATALGDNTTQWDVTEYNSTTAQFTWDGTGTNPQILANLSVGDSVQIPTSFHPNNQGTYTITAVSSTYFRVVNPPVVVSTDPDFNDSGQWTYNATYWTYQGSGIPTDYSFRRNTSGAGTGFTVTQASIMTVGKHYEFSGETTAVSGTGGTDGFYMSGITATRVTSVGSFSRSGDATSVTGGFGANVAANWITSFQITYTGRKAETNITGGTITITSEGDFTLTKASISGTTLTETAQIDCDTGGTEGLFDRFAVDDNYIIAYDTSSPYTYNKFNKSTGELLNTSTGVINAGLINSEGVPLLIEGTNDTYLRIPI